MPEYKGVRFSTPRDVGGLLNERPKSATKIPISSSALATLIKGGILAMAAPATHRVIFSQFVAKGVKEGAEAELARLRAQGEANRPLPNRTSFSADPSAASAKPSFKRGDSVVHMAGHRRGVVLGQSKSKPGFLKVVIDGEVFRVSPKNLSKL